MNKYLEDRLNDDHFKLPQWLDNLIQKNIFPANYHDCPVFKLPLFAIPGCREGEESIELMPYPFLNLKYGYTKHYIDAFPGDPLKAYTIGDFGIGSDASLVLDYNHNPPKLMCSYWSGENMFRKNPVIWFQCIDSPDTFSDMLLKQKKN